MRYKEVIKYDVEVKLKLKNGNDVTQTFRVLGNIKNARPEYIVREYLENQKEDVCIDFVDAHTFTLVNSEYVIVLEDYAEGHDL
jgi:hypothetical protein